MLTAFCVATGSSVALAVPQKTKTRPVAAFDKSISVLLDIRRLRFDEGPIIAVDRVSLRSEHAVRSPSRRR